MTDMYVRQQTYCSMLGSIVYTCSEQVRS